MPAPAILFLLFLASVSAVQPAPLPPRIPVVVELFTSEGCSSCPPADALLAKLALEQDVPGVQVIALGLHVTYWDRLGWKDPFSLPLATDRQQQYSRRFGEDRVYTPQVVVDGREEMVGSDEASIRKSIARAAIEPHTAIRLQPHFSPAGVQVALSVPAFPAAAKEPLDLLLFVTEGGLRTDVRHGENAGRTLRHESVVRGMTKVGVIDAQTKYPFETSAFSRASEEHLRPANPWLVVAVLQGRRTGKIWGAGIR